MLRRKETNVQVKIEIFSSRIKRVSNLLNQRRNMVILLNTYRTVCKRSGVGAGDPRLIEECWHSNRMVRPTFSQIIMCLDKIVLNCSKQGWWKDTFKLPWYAHAFLCFLSRFIDVYCLLYSLSKQQTRKVKNCGF